MHFFVPFCCFVLLTILIVNILNLQPPLFQSVSAFSVTAACIIFIIYINIINRNGLLKENLTKIFAFLLVFLSLLSLLSPRLITVLGEIIDLKSTVFLLTALFLMLLVSSLNNEEKIFTETPLKHYNDISKQTTIYILLVISLVAFVTRVYIGMKTNIDLDEGQLLYDAHLLNNGFVLFKDFTSRSPILLWMLVISEKIIGNFGIINAKILISTLYLLFGFYIYKFYRFREVSRKESILFLTFIISFPVILYYSVVLHVAQAFVPFLIMAIYYFCIFLKKQKKIHLVLSSVLIAITYLVRGEVITYLPIFILFLIVKKDLRQSLKNICIFSICGLSAYLILSYPFINRVGLLVYDQYYGLQSLVSQSHKAAALLSASKYFIVSSWFVLIAPFLYVCLLRLNMIVFSKKTVLTKYVHVIISTIFFAVYIFLITQFNSGKTGGYSVFNSKYFLIYLIYNVFFIYYINKYHKQIIESGDKKNNKVEFFLVLQIIFPLFIIITRLNDVNTNYFLASTVLILIISLPPILNMLKIFYNENKLRLYFFIIIGLTIIINQNVEFFVSKTHERAYSHDLLAYVSKDIKNFTHTNDQIFTADTTLVINGSREINPPITHHTIYFGNTNNWNLLLPTVNNIAKTLEDKHVELVVVGFRTKDLINLSDNLGAYLKNEYMEIDIINRDGQEIQIYKKNNGY